MPLVLLAALCRDQSNPFGDTDTCTKQGTAYISFGQWVSFIQISVSVSVSIYKIQKPQFRLIDQKIKKILILIKIIKFYNFNISIIYNIVFIFNIIVKYNIYNK